jgi:hypothetical protein
MRSVWSLLALIVAIGLFSSDADAGRKGCRSCKPRKAQRHYRLKSVNRGVSQVKQSSCSGGVCRPPVRTIEKTKTILKTTDHSVYLKAWAEEECRLQAQAGRVGHFRRTPAGARFVGVGSGGKTCMASGEPLAVAHFGGYSCRVW